ncbi:hypothetical protein [Streptomyces sulphureus]|uniref:hypothetical protein n=1 Tax=Streptomyces sulphureus TaxID=47758 RepID=UPI000363FAF3|nr:hypothetical protein [Streptomyces sulphureus]
MSARPSEQPLPALTRAECRLVDTYLDALDDLGRINPARGRDTYTGLRAAQALVRHAAELRDALTLMHQRGEDRIDHEALVRALLVLDGELRASRVELRRRA